MGKRIRTPYFWVGLFVLGSLISNVYFSFQFFKLPEKIEEFYQKDFVDIRVISEQLIRDIEKKYGKEFPLAELNIRLSGNSKTGIRYKDNSKTLQLFLPTEIIFFDNNQKRVYLAHEFGHHVLGHLDHKNPNVYSFFGDRDLAREIEADFFALNFSNVKDLSWVIKKLVWDESEYKTRIYAIGVDP